MGCVLLHKNSGLVFKSMSWINDCGVTILSLCRLRWRLPYNLWDFIRSYFSKIYILSSLWVMEGTFLFTLECAFSLETSTEMLIWRWLDRFGCWGNLRMNCFRSVWSVWLSCILPYSIGTGLAGAEGVAGWWEAIGDEMLRFDKLEGRRRLLLWVRLDFL